MNPSMAQSEYGLWFLVVLNSLVFIIFAFSFAKPSRSRDWTSFGAFSAFIAHDSFNFIALKSFMRNHALFIVERWLA